MPRSGQELYEMTCLVGELLPPLPGDGVFAVDSLLAAPRTLLCNPMVWQWQDDRGAWHTYPYQVHTLIINAVQFCCALLFKSTEQVPVGMS